MSAREELIHYQRTGLAGVADLVPAPPPGIEVRSAVAATDLSIIADLYNAAFERIEDRVTEADIAGYARHPGLAAHGVFLAFDGALAVGMVVGRLDVPAPGGETRRAAIELLAVRPGYRRRGIGATLIGDLLARWASIGVETVGAAVGPPGRDMGVGTLLERYGFRRVK